MKKIGFISGIVCSLVGCLTLIFTSIIKELLPKYAFLKFETAGDARYTESAYILNFTFANVIAVILIAAGLIFAVYCFYTEIKKSSK